MIKMKKYLIYTSIILFVISCSPKLEKQLQDKTENKQQTKEKEYAQQLFIDASLLDIQEKYAEAILDYQDALRYDPSAGIHYALAKDYLRLSKLYPALEHAKKAVKMDNKNVEYLTLLGTVYSVGSKTDSSKIIFNKIVKLDSTNITARMNLARLYEQENSPSKAINQYNKVLKIIGPESNILIKIAALNEKMGKVDATIKTVENLLELNPSNLLLKKLLIESYIKNKKYDEALELVNNTLEIFPDDISLIDLKGNTLIKLKMWNEASKEYTKIIDSGKTPFETKLKIGAAFYSKALSDSTVIPLAENILTKVDEDSSDWQIKAYLGELAQKRNDDSLMKKYFKESIDLAEWNVDLWIRYGQILFENGNYEEASLEMKKAVQKFPNNFVINFILGLSLAQSSGHEEAVKYLKKAADIDPNNLNVLLAYSFSLNSLKKDDEALVYLERALRVDPNNIEVLGMMGLIYDGKKMFNKSDSLYSKAVSLDSTNILLLNNFAYSLAERGIQLEKALKMVKKAVEKEPENSSYLDTIGWVYYQMGKYDDAVNYINKAIEHDNDNPTLLDHLGDVYFKMNKKDKAKKIWQNAYELDTTKADIKLKIEKGL
jgi:tetratricopeptide (TPR) repeat protein